MVESVVEDTQWAVVCGFDGFIYHEIFGRAAWGGGARGMVWDGMRCGILEAEFMLFGAMQGDGHIQCYGHIQC
jgi:hypothetical protein